MKYYKDENNNFYAYEDDVKDIKKGLVKSSKEELKSYQAQIAIDNHVAEKLEIAKLQRYLDDTDCHSIKCIERKLDIETEYPTEYIKRQESREKIHKLKETLNISSKV